MAPMPVDPLAAWLDEQLGIELLSRVPVGGGCIHQAWCLRTESGRLFAKTNQVARRPLLEAEAEGLVALGQVAPQGLVVPQPLALGQSGDVAVLVLPWLDLVRADVASGSWAECGAQLARLHRRSLQLLEFEPRGQAFGWPRNNYVGASPQVNDWRDDWADFFVACRLRPQLLWLAQGGLPLEGADRLLEGVPRWLEGHVAEACLVHGDLWSGNAALLADGGCSIFDPAIYRGDREVDLAMARLFGGFPESFFHGYQEEWPLRAGWQRREKIYNLYHLLNHANLFGTGYKKQAQSVIDSLIGR
ncbi:MAG: hypothetical protein RLZZ117_1305 [Cyanobacteriota bacterium]